LTGSSLSTARGIEYVGFIKEIKRKDIVIEIVETRTPSNKESSKITLIQAIPKKEKMDYIAEKAVELGVASIIPVTTGRTIPDWGTIKNRPQALRGGAGIAGEAAKQCGRTDIPEISAIKTFPESMKGSDGYDLALIAVLGEKGSSR